MPNRPESIDLRLHTLDGQLQLACPACGWHDHFDDRSIPLGFALVAASRHIRYHHDPAATAVIPPWDAA